MALAHSPLTKFGFKIRTRSGLPVDNLIVHARTQAEAEGKIAQMYLHCEILECRTLTAPAKEDSADLESIISLIAKQGDNRK